MLKAALLFIALLILGLPGKSQAWTHGLYVNPCPGTDAAPAPASAFGLTCESFADNFTSSSTVDTANTGQPGFNWYVSQSFNNGFWPTGIGPTPSGDYSFGAGGVTLSPQSSAPYQSAAFPTILYNTMFSTCGYAANAQGYVGKAFKPPFYVRVEASISGTWNNLVPWPTAWMFPTEYLTAGYQNGLVVTEIDIFESLYGRTLHEWKFTSSNFTYNNYPTANLGGNANTWGELVIPTTANSGTGLVYLYYMDILTVDSETTYSAAAAPTYGGVPQAYPAGTFMSLDTNHQCLMLSAGVHYPMVVRSVQVWQAPP